jgi:hypothetical protein
LWIVVAAVLAALACVAASARRLWFAAHATVLHPDDVIELLEREGPAVLASLREAVAKDPDADWERDLFAALAAPRPEVRAALVNEQLTELDHRLQRWARVPRVCASVATSVGILLGTLVLRRGLAEAPDLTGELGELFVRDVLGDAISVASLGVIGTAFCIGAHAHARRMTRERTQAADRMIEKLEAAAAAATSVREG